MTDNSFQEIFTDEKLKQLFPEDRSDLFFDALYGDVSEGAYDIALKFKEAQQNKLRFEFYLKKRPGKCLACNLTYGLPEVFSRHPIINVNQIVKDILSVLDKNMNSVKWEMGATREISSELHIIELDVFCCPFGTME